MIEEPDTYEKIVVLDSEVEAGLVEALLAEHGLPHRLQTYRDSAYDGLFQGALGWGHVEAPAAFRAEILELVADLKQSRGAELEEPAD